MTGFVVDDENPLPWFKELTETKSWRERTLALTGPTACPGSSLDQSYHHQIDSLSNGERSSLNSEVDKIYQADTAEAEVDDPITSVPVGAPEDINEVTDAAVYAALAEAINAPIDAAMDASWVVSAAVGVWRSVPCAT